MRNQLWGKQYSILHLPFVVLGAVHNNKNNNTDNNNNNNNNAVIISWSRDIDREFYLVSKVSRKHENLLSCNVQSNWWTDLVSLVWTVSFSNCVTDNKEYDAYLYYTKVDFNSLCRSVVSDSSDWSHHQNHLQFVPHCTVCWITATSIVSPYVERLLFCATPTKPCIKNWKKENAYFSLEQLLLNITLLGHPFESWVDMAHIESHRSSCTSP